MNRPDLATLTRAAARDLALSVHREFEEAGAVPADFSLELTRLVELQLMLRLHAPSGGAVVDVGCGNGYMAVIARRLGYEMRAMDYFGFELEEGIGDHDRALADRYRQVWDRYGVTVEGCDVAARPLPVASGACDAVICCAVLEHLLRPPTFALRELARVVRPGGVVIVEVPNVAQLRNRLLLLAGRSIHMPLAQFLDYPYLDHTREYTRDEVHAMLRRAGLVPLSTACFNNETVRRGVRLRRWQELGTATRAVWHMQRIASTLWPTWRQAIMVAAQRPRSGREAGHP